MTTLATTTDDSDLFRYTTGPRDARIVFVGEAWGFKEHNAKQPFVGTSGEELDRILSDAKLSREKVLCTNVFSVRPEGDEAWRLFNPRPKKGDTTLELWGLHPTKEAQYHIDRLYDLLARVSPDVVVAVGNYALWALTPDARISYSAQQGSRNYPTGVMDYRGSMLWSRTYRNLREPLKVLPIIHPAAILRQWQHRAVCVHDLSIRIPLALSNDWTPPHEPELLYKPSYKEAKDYFESRLAVLDAGERIETACDIETLKSRHITCIGFCDSPNFAFTLPLIDIDPERRGFKSYWTSLEEAHLTRLMLRYVTHKNILLEGQNFNYDKQYFYECYGVNLRCDFDTMTGQHLLLPGTRLGLGHLSSLYCKYHRYWKDDNKDWAGKDTTDDHYRYNAEDCLRTREIAKVLRAQISKSGLDHLLSEEMEMHQLLFDIMIRGVKIDVNRKTQLSLELTDASVARERLLLKIIPQHYVDPEAKSPWYRSPAQQQDVFYNLLQMDKRYHRKTGNVTLDKEAIPALKKKYPEWTLVFDLLLELRSIGVFKSTFVDAPLSRDNRMRCSFNLEGTETFRFSSSSNAFHEGTNLQNIPKGDE